MVITDETQSKQLENCVTINGSLTFQSFTYSNVSFPNLLFIEGSLKIQEIDNLASFRQLLPNLVHIHAVVQKLEFALSITNNKDLEKLEFNRLMRIDSGVVQVYKNPRLCLNDITSWLQIQENTSPIKKRIEV